MKIKDYPKLDRPREKLLHYRDTSRLKTEELLAIILGSGNKSENVLVLARKILKLITANLGHVTIADFEKIRGIGKTKAAQTVATLELGHRFADLKKQRSVISPADIWKDLHAVRESKKEHFFVYYLDIKNTIIKKELISLGSLNASIVHPREVFEPAIRNLAAHIILAHNHPSGDPSPSEADIQITKKIVQAGKILDIEVLDHVVIASVGFTSLKENKLI